MDHRLRDRPVVLPRWGEMGAERTSAPAIHFWHPSKPPQMRLAKRGNRAVDYPSWCGTGQGHLGAEGGYSRGDSHPCPRNADEHTRADGHQHCSTNADQYTHANGHTYPDADQYTRTDGHTYPNADQYTRADGYAHPNADQYTRADGYTHPDANRHVDGDSHDHPDDDTDGDTHFYGYGDYYTAFFDPDSYANTHADSYSHGDTDTPAACCAHLVRTGQWGGFQWMER